LPGRIWGFGFSRSRSSLPFWAPGFPFSTYLGPFYSPSPFCSCPVAFFYALSQRGLCPPSIYMGPPRLAPFFDFFFPPPRFYRASHPTSPFFGWFQEGACCSPMSRGFPTRRSLCLVRPSRNFADCLALRAPTQLPQPPCWSCSPWATFPVFSVR